MTSFTLIASQVANGQPYPLEEPSDRPCATQLSVMYQDPIVKLAEALSKPCHYDGLADLLATHIKVLSGRERRERRERGGSRIIDDEAFCQDLDKRYQSQTCHKHIGKLTRNDLVSFRLTFASRFPEKLAVWETQNSLKAIIRDYQGIAAVQDEALQNPVLMGRLGHVYENKPLSEIFQCLPSHFMEKDLNPARACEGYDNEVDKTFEDFASYVSMPKAMEDALEDIKNQCRTGSHCDMTNYLLPENYGELVGRHPGVDNFSHLTLDMRVSEQKRREKAKHKPIQFFSQLYQNLHPDGSGKSHFWRSAMRDWEAMVKKVEGNPAEVDRFVDDVLMERKKEALKLLDSGGQAKQRRLGEGLFTNFRSKVKNSALLGYKVRQFIKEELGSKPGVAIDEQLLADKLKTASGKQLRELFENDPILGVDLKRFGRTAGDAMLKDLIKEVDATVKSKGQRRGQDHLSYLTALMKLKGERVIKAVDGCKAVKQDIHKMCKRHYKGAPIRFRATKASEVLKDLLKRSESFSRNQTSDQESFKSALLACYALKRARVKTKRECQDLKENLVSSSEGRAELESWEEIFFPRRCYKSSSGVLNRAKASKAAGLRSSSGRSFSAALFDPRTKEERKGSQGVKNLASSFLSSGSGEKIDKDFKSKGFFEEKTSHSGESDFGPRPGDGWYDQFLDPRLAIKNPGRASAEVGSADEDGSRLDLDEKLEFEELNRASTDPEVRSLLSEMQKMREDNEKLRRELIEAFKKNKVESASDLDKLSQKDPQVDGQLKEFQQLQKQYEKLRERVIAKSKSSAEGGESASLPGRGVAGGPGSQPSPEATSTAGSINSGTSAGRAPASLASGGGRSSRESGSSNLSSSGQVKLEASQIDSSAKALAADSVADYKVVKNYEKIAELLAKGESIIYVDPEDNKFLPRLDPKTGKIVFVPVEGKNIKVGESWALPKEPGKKGKTVRQVTGRADPKRHRNIQSKARKALESIGLGGLFE